LISKIWSKNVQYIYFVQITDKYLYFRLRHNQRVDYIPQNFDFKGVKWRFVGFGIQLWRRDEITLITVVLYYCEVWLFPNMNYKVKFYTIY
jgi:hypothetical protein